MKKYCLFLIISASVVMPSMSNAQWELLAPNIIDNKSDIYYGVIYSKDGIVWAGRDALWMSADTGRTWVLRGPPLKRYEYICDIRFFDDNIGMLGTTGGNVYGTRDRGFTWSKLKEYRSYVAQTLCYAGSVNDIIVGFSDYGSAYGSLSVSHDGGMSWRDSIQLKDYVQYVYPTPGGDIYTMAGTIYPRSMHLEVSTDRGDTWKEQPGKVDPDCYSFVADNCTVVASNEAYAYSYDLEADVFRSTDQGTSWQSPTKFPKAVLTGCISASADALFIQSVDEVLRSTDQGITWVELGGPGAGWDSRYVTAFDNNIIFAVDAKGSIYRTLNSGADSLVIKGGSGLAESLKFSSSRIINNSFNVTVRLPIFFHHSGTMNDIDMVIHYPTESLKLTGTSLYNRKSFDVSGSEWPGRAALHFAAADLNAAPDSLLGYVNFLWTPFEVDCDEIFFDSIDTHITESPCSGPLTASPFKGIIGSYSTCGAAAVMAQVSKPVTLSIYPNPATSTFTIEVSGNTASSHYELFDPLGSTLMRGAITGSSTTLDASSLAIGNYYLRVSSEGASPSTKRIVIVK